VVVSSTIGPIVSVVRFSVVISVVDSVVDVSEGSGMYVICSVVADVASIVVDDGVLHEESHSHEHVQYGSLVIVLTPSDIAGIVVLHVVGTVNGGVHLQPQTQF
jgi:hypothetical protein